MLDSLQPHLSKTKVSQYRYFKSIGSTNDEALVWSNAGADDFSLVIADEQTKGRGRFDRRWITKPGSSLAFSLILKPRQEEIFRIPLFSPLCAIAVQETVNQYSSQAVEIKWPNDVLINRRKFCGILVEASWMDGKVSGIVMGIGINITLESVPHSDSQQFPATSLEEAISQKLDRYLLLQQILQSLEKWREKIGSSEFMNTWQTHLAFKGEMVRIEHSGKPSIIGKMKGIDDQGNLILFTDDGKEMSFVIGDVHLRPGIGEQYAG